MWQGGQTSRQAWRPLALQLSLHCLWGQGLGAGAGVTIRRTQPRTEEEAVQDTSAVQWALWTSHFSVPKPRGVVPGQGDEEDVHGQGRRFLPVGSSLPWPGPQIRDSACAWQH